MGDLSRDYSEHEFQCRFGCDRAELNRRLVEAPQELRDLAGPRSLTAPGWSIPSTPFSVLCRKLLAMFSLPG